MDRIDATLLKGIEAIEPYLGEVVVVGGWVPYLFEFMYDAENTGRALRTSDIDLAIPRCGFIDDIPNLDETIRAAGFGHRFCSLDIPPVIKYVMPFGDNEEIEIEFLTDASGGAEGVVEVESITAQGLHYVGLLLEDSWNIDLGDFGEGRSLIVRVPNPSAFIFHKALVSRKRSKAQKRDKDLYYIFFVLQAFPAWRKETLQVLSAYASKRPSLFCDSFRYLAQAYADIDAWGVDALVSQRPQTAFPKLNESQFRQYSLSIMNEMISAMSDAVARSEAEKS